MQVQLNPSISTNNSNYKNKSNASFKASPEAAKEAIQKTTLYTQEARDFLTWIVSAFIEAKEAILSKGGLTYNLLGTQHVSPEIKAIRIADGHEIAYFDRLLKTPDDTYSKTNQSFRRMLNAVMVDQRVPNSSTLDIQ